MIRKKCDSNELETNMHVGIMCEVRGSIHSDVASIFTLVGPRIYLQLCDIYMR